MNDRAVTPPAGSSVVGSASPAASAPQLRPFTWRHAHRWLYDWVLSWANTRYGDVALFVIAFVESSFFPIPPDVLLIALVIGARQRWLWLTFVCTAGSVLGGLAGYWIGATLMDSVGQRIISFYHAEKHWAYVTDAFTKYDVWIVFAAAFTPIPYKVFTIAAGAFHMNWLSFALVSFVGRGARFILVAGLLYLFGQPLRAFIEKYFDLLSVVFLVLLVGGFVAVRYLL